MRAGRCVWYELSRGDESYLCVVLIRDLQIDFPYKEETPAGKQLPQSGSARSQNE
jgi:hypothetical protein